MAYNWQFTPDGMTYMMQNYPSYWVHISTIMNQEKMTAGDDDDADLEDQVPHVALSFFHAIEHAEEAAEELQFPYERALAWAAIANAYAQVLCE